MQTHYTGKFLVTVEKLCLQLFKFCFFSFKLPGPAKQDRKHTQGNIKRISRQSPGEMIQPPSSPKSFNPPLQYDQMLSKPKRKIHEVTTSTRSTNDKNEYSTQGVDQSLSKGDSKSKKSARF